MFKFQIKCPHCKKNIEYNIMSRNYDNITCSHCKKNISVEMRYIVPVISLFIFVICYELYAVFFRQYISIFIALIIGVVAAFLITIAILQLLVNKFGSGVVFEIKQKSKKK